MTDDGLVDQARRFATEISQTVHALVPGCAPFTAEAVGSRFTVEQSPATGIPLRVGGRPLLTLHFPLGGSRFRPCLEDLLEMLVSELGVDSTRKVVSRSARDGSGGAASRCAPSSATHRMRPSPSSASSGTT